MRRKLFTLAAAVSAVLFVGVCGLWVWSYREWHRLDSVTVKPPPDPEWVRTEFVAHRGVVAAVIIRHRLHYHGTDPHRARRFQSDKVVDPERLFLSLLMTPYPVRYDNGRRTVVASNFKPGEAAAGFQFRHDFKGTDDWGSSVFKNYQYDAADTRAALPCWLLAGLTAIAPAARLYRWYQTRRAAAHAFRGLCPSCGYDLRVTPGRCPECGAVPAQKPCQPA